jgi:tetratricopeptide (TPR) repeat protein
MNEAAALFKAGQHVEAADKLMLVYDTDPQPLLLFNAGQAYRRAKRPSQAKEAYQRFLSAAPEHSLVPEVRGYVRDMDTLLEMQQREQQISLQLQQEKEVSTSAQQALQKERSKPLHKRPLFWGLVAGVGIAAVAAATIGGIIGVRVQADVKADIQK